MCVDHALEEGHGVGVAGAAAVDLEVSQKVAPGKCDIGSLLILPVDGIHVFSDKILKNLTFFFTQI